MSQEITTTDLTKFGYREIRMMIELLEAWMVHGLPEDFEEDEVQVMFNTHSGCVFLTNPEYQAAMMNRDKLEIWYNCPECGNEGFLEDFTEEMGETCEGCKEIWEKKLVQEGSR